MKDLPDNYGYKFLSQELTRYRMKVVDETLAIRDIEEKIAGGLVEELIFQAHNEIKLLRIMKRWKPWEYLHTNDFENKEAMRSMLNFNNSNPFPEAYERYDNQKHEANERRPSAAVHPESRKD